MGTAIVDQIKCRPVTSVRLLGGKEGVIKPYGPWLQTAMMCVTLADWACMLLQVQASMFRQRGSAGCRQNRPWACGHGLHTASAPTLVCWRRRVFPQPWQCCSLAGQPTAHSSVRICICPTMRSERRVDASVDEADPRQAP
jgi:hypothetical protein